MSQAKRAHSQDKKAKRQRAESLANLATSLLMEEAAEAIFKGTEQTLASIDENQASLGEPSRATLSEFYDRWIGDPACREVFAQLGALVKDKLLAEVGPTESVAGTPLLACNGHAYELALPTFVGRAEGCQVRIVDPERSVSRHQFLALPLPELDLLALVPFGGRAATRTLRRSASEPCLASTAAHPVVLVFRLDEEVHLRLSRNYQLVLNPSQCMVCFKRTPRSLACGHALVCAFCHANGRVCPLCVEDLGATLPDPKK